jgi:membrane protease YdiL (CAAX protease family)
MSQSLVVETRAPSRRILSTLALAIGSGCAFAVLGLGAWGGLLTLGMRSPQYFPFGLALMGGFLIAALTWLKWGRWPKAGLDFRRNAVRLDLVSPRIFGLSLAGGLSTMLAGFLLYVAHRTLAGMGGEGALVLPHASFAALLPGLVMAGIVAGVIEEVAFRGFMQTTLERRFGIIPAIAVSGFVWALFHTNHAYFGEEAIVWFGIFLAVATMLGLIAHRTRSLVPGVAVHSSFDTIYFVAAGLLAPCSTPIAWLQSFASPATLIAAATLMAIVACASWVAFWRQTKSREVADEQSY